MVNPLFFGVSLKESRTAHMLIRSGANVVENDFSGTSVLELAKVTGNTELATITLL